MSFLEENTSEPHSAPSFMDDPLFKSIAPAALRGLSSSAPSNTTSGVVDRTTLIKKEDSDINHCAVCYHQACDCPSADSLKPLYSGEDLPFKTSRGVSHPVAVKSEESSVVYRQPTTISPKKSNNPSPKKEVAYRPLAFGAAPIALKECTNQPSKNGGVARPMAVKSEKPSVDCHQSVTVSPKKTNNPSPKKKGIACTPLSFGDDFIVLKKCTNPPPKNGGFSHPVAVKSKKTSVGCHQSVTISPKKFKNTSPKKTGIAYHPLSFGANLVVLKKRKAETSSANYQQAAATPSNNKGNARPGPAKPERTPEEHNKAIDLVMWKLRNQTPKNRGIPQSKITQKQTPPINNQQTAIVPPENVTKPSRNTKRKRGPDEPETPKKVRKIRRITRTGQIVAPLSDISSEVELAREFEEQNREKLKQKHKHRQMAELIGLNKDAGSSVPGGESNRTATESTAPSSPCSVEMPMVTTRYLSPANYTHIGLWCQELPDFDSPPPPPSKWSGASSGYSSKVPGPNNYSQLTSGRFSGPKLYTPLMNNPPRFGLHLNKGEKFTSATQTYGTERWTNPGTGKWSG